MNNMPNKDPTIFSFIISCFDYIASGIARNGSLFLGMLWAAIVAYLGQARKEMISGQKISHKLIDSLICALTACAVSQFVSYVIKESPYSDYETLPIFIGTIVGYLGVDNIKLLSIRLYELAVSIINKVIK